MTGKGLKAPQRSKHSLNLEDGLTTEEPVKGKLQSSCLEALSCVCGWDGEDLRGSSLLDNNI